MELRARGYRLIAGVDEVGRGALMGPVVAAAVVLPEKFRGKWKSKVRDSKQLSPKDREYLYECIREVAISVGVGMSSNEVIDLIGIAPATRRAMLEAVDGLRHEPDYLLIDYFHLPETQLPHHGVLHGDSLCFSIACASIIAKVTRDRHIIELDGRYPGYGFADHKGYSTADHLTCLRALGPCPEHRRSYEPVRAVLGLDETA